MMPRKKRFEDMTEEEQKEAARLDWERLPEEEKRRLRDLEVCERNREWIFRRHRVIKDKAGKIRRMKKLKRAQQKVLAVLRYCRERKMPARVIIGKSRKQGVTTIVCADCYEEVKAHQLNALVVAHEKKLANEVIVMFGRFYKYDDLPKPAPYKGKLNLRELKFEEHDGHITTASAKNIYSGTGETPQYGFFTEGSKWDRGNETKTALLQSIGDNPETTLIEESTFNGQEDCFLPTWRAAFDNCRVTFSDVEGAKEDATLPALEAHVEVTNHTEWNGYIPVFISVLDDEDARLAFLSEEDKGRFAQTLDPYERMVVERYQATLEFLNWRRRTLKLKCQNNLDILKQEYPITEDEAIRASGRMRFNAEQIDLMPVEDGQIGRLETSEDWLHKVIWKPDKGENLTIFRHPKRGHHYILAIDTGEGSDTEDDDSKTLEERLDKTSMNVFDLDGGFEQVANYRNILRPEQSGPIAVLLAEYFANAFIVAESNSTGAVLCVYLAENYDNTLLYHRDDWNPEKTRQVRAVGHKTTVVNRDIIIGALADRINENQIVFHSKDTVAEMRSFVIKRGKAQAASGKHDDEVMSSALACAGARKAVQIFENRRKVQGRGSTSFQIAHPTAAKARETRNQITGY